MNYPFKDSNTEQTTISCCYMNATLEFSLILYCIIKCAINHLSVYYIGETALGLFSD